LDTKGSECLFIAPEPTCGISAEFAKKAARDWMNRDHKTPWEPIKVLKHVKDFLQRPSTRWIRELLEPDRNQLRWGTELLTGQSPERTSFQIGTNQQPRL
jgi:hypothetical protein